MKVWQIAAGRSGRDYRDLFFEHDVMIIGPGSGGSALEKCYSDGVGASIGNQIDIFAKDPEPGDRVIMRLGQTMVGIGEIPEGTKSQYSFEQSFRTVYGWDLRHSRRVKWARRGELGQLSHFSSKAFQQPTFTRVRDDRLIRAAAAIPASRFRRPLKKKPSYDSSVYTEEELGEKLFGAGISNRSVADIHGALRQADYLYSWYRQDKSGQRPSEHEVISHIILPLFLGLGWSHQQMAVEWNNIDVAFFKGTPTSEENCVMVLEAKGMGQGLDDVLDQPTMYVHRNGLRRARYIVVTNGQILLVYGRTCRSWDTTPIGFLDVSCLQKQYVLPKGTSPVDTLVMLQPSALK